MKAGERDGCADQPPLDAPNFGHNETIANQLRDEACDDERVDPDRHLD